MALRPAIMAFKGRVSIERASHPELISAKWGERILTGDRIATAESSVVSIYLKEASLGMSELTTVTISTDEVIRLDSGKIRYYLPQVLARGAHQIHTPNAVITLPDGEVEVEVKRRPDDSRAGVTTEICVTGGSAVVGPVGAGQRRGLFPDECVSVTGTDLGLAYAAPRP